jgi:hypothetical protein
MRTKSFLMLSIFLCASTVHALETGNEEDFASQRLGDVKSSLENPTELKILKEIKVPANVKMLYFKNGEVSSEFPKALWFGSPVCFLHFSPSPEERVMTPNELSRLIVAGEKDRYFSENGKADGLGLYSMMFGGKMAYLECLKFGWGSIFSKEETVDGQKKTARDFHATVGDLNKATAGIFELVPSWRVKNMSVSPQLLLDLLLGKEQNAEESPPGPADVPPPPEMPPEENGAAI